MSLLLWPLAVLWALVKLVFWPVVLLAVAWGVMRLIDAPHSAYVWAAVVAAVYLLLVLWLWVQSLAGRVRSIERGSLNIRTGRRGGGW